MAAAKQTLTLPDSRALSYSLSATPANGPIVVLANSLCCNFDSWAHVVDRLAAAGFRTLRYDQPGHGDSGVPSDLGSTTFTSIAADAHALLQHLGLSTVHGWIGVSMGAATGVYFASAYPGVIQRLVVCDTITGSPGNTGVQDLFGPRVEAARSAGNMEATTQSTLERWFGNAWLSAHPEEAARMRSLMLTTSIDGFETCCAALRNDNFNLRPHLEKAGAGVQAALCVVGENDANLPTTMEELRAGIEKGLGGEKTVELKVIKNTGHVCYIDGLDDFVSTVLPFLK